jgi:hypothetical protein
MSIVEFATVVRAVVSEFTDEVSVSTVWSCIAAESIVIGPAAVFGGPPTTHPLRGVVM